MAGRIDETIEQVYVICGGIAFVRRRIGDKSRIGVCGLFEIPQHIKQEILDEHPDQAWRFK